MLQSFREQEIHYQHVIHGFSDSLLACRHYYKSPCDLDSMLDHFKIKAEVMHDAFCDARILCFLVLELGNVFREDDFTFLTNRKWFKSLRELENSVKPQSVLPDVALEATKSEQINFENIKSNENKNVTERRRNIEKAVSNTNLTQEDSVKNVNVNPIVQTFKRSSLDKYKIILSLVGVIGSFMYYLCSYCSFFMLIVYALAFYGFLEAWKKVEYYHIFNHYRCSHLDKIKTLLAILGVIVLIYFTCFTLYNKTSEIFDFTNVCYTFLFLLGAFYTTYFIKSNIDCITNSM